MTAAAAATCIASRDSRLKLPRPAEPPKKTIQPPDMRCYSIMHLESGIQEAFRHHEQCRQKAAKQVQGRIAILQTGQRHNTRASDGAGWQAASRKAYHSLDARFTAGLSMVAGHDSDIQCQQYASTRMCINGIVVCDTLTVWLLFL